MARSFPLAGFGGCAALFRWWGYFVPHLRALIWNAFSCRIARPRGFPSGGSCHRRGRMRGRPGCPTGQEKKPVGATGSNPLFYKERLGTESPPHPPQCAHWGTFPPRGRLWGVGRTLPVCETTSPSPPSWGAGRYGRWFMGRRPGRKKERTHQGPPNQKRWVQGGRTSSSLVFFPPAFFQRKPGSPAGVGGGNPRRRFGPAPVQDTLTGGPPLTPPAAGRRPGHAPPVGSPAPPGRAPRPQWCWGARPG